MKAITIILLLCFVTFDVLPQSTSVEKTIANTFILIDNEAKTLKDLSDEKPLLLAFFSTSCVECKKQIPSLRDVYQKFGNEVVFYAINIDAGISEDALANYVVDKQYPLPVTIDFGKHLQRLFGVPGTPTYIYIDVVGNAVTKAHSINGNLLSRHGIAATEK